MNVRHGVLVLLGLVLVCHPVPVAVSGSERFQATERILARAQQWAGGVQFESVKSLAVKTTVGPRGQAQRTMDVFLLRPDRCQTQREGGWVHTLERASFWMTVPPGFQASFSTEMRAAADVNTRQTCLDMSMLFLLRPMEGLGATVTMVGDVDLGGLRGQALRAALPGKDGTTFVFDPSDGRPLGYVRQRVGASEMDVAFVKGHGLTAGARFPTRIETHYLPSDRVVDWNVSEVRINALTPADFSRRGEGNAYSIARRNPAVLPSFRR